MTFFLNIFGLMTIDLLVSQNQTQDTTFVKTRAGNVDVSVCVAMVKEFVEYGYVCQVSTMVVQT